MNIKQVIQNFYRELHFKEYKKIDLYIIKKFLGTFFFSILLIMAIAIIFDTAEKIDDFMEKKAPLNAIVFDYFLNFLPYFAILYSHLFTFIAVLYFTSKLAYRSEIIAILSAGVSYKRLLYPYMLGAAIITIFSYTFTNFVVPDANKVRLEFEERYIRSGPVKISFRNMHKQISPGVVIYLENYSNISNTGYKFSIEKYENNQLVSKLMSEYVVWDSVKQKWNIRDYFIRDINNNKETITTGSSIDTTLNMHPDDFRRRMSVVETMNLFELNEFIEELKLQGADNIDAYLIEKYKRLALPLSTFILTFIGVCVSSRKVRGGTGLHIGIGMGIGFSHILFMQFSSQFAISGTLNPLLAVWIPNILFSIVAIYLYKKAPK